MSTNTEQPPSDSAEANKADGGDRNPSLVSRWVETAIRVQDREVAMSRGLKPLRPQNADVRRDDGKGHPL